nr:PLP-dependent aminotransferase family protein [Ardenticatenaceae bacterium]
GLEPLRAWIAERVPPAAADDVCIVCGSQQVIDLVGKVMLDPGDKVVVSAPTYTASITSLRVYEPEFISVPYDNEGFVPEALEDALRQRPKLLYAIPNFMNPSGVRMTLERRQQLIELARRYDVPILEDDPYGELRFEGTPLPNLFELAPEQVIYGGTFSKIIAPGLRVGWIVAPADALPKLTVAKQTTDLQTGIYQQTLLYEIVSRMDMEEHIQRVRTYYRRQRDAMLEAMDAYFPAEIKYERPAGGMFIWCELPQGADAGELLQEALARKVAYIPGAAFFANADGQNTLRLSYTLASERQIRDGIQILGELFSDQL